jgi:hypothetical protein
VSAGRMPMITVPFSEVPVSTWHQGHAMISSRSAVVVNGQGGCGCRRGISPSPG